MEGPSYLQISYPPIFLSLIKMTVNKTCSLETFTLELRIHNNTLLLNRLFKEESTDALIFTADGKRTRRDLGIAVENIG